MKVVTVVGTRPQLIKSAAVQPVLRERYHEVFVDTGQHYDRDMAGDFFSELGLAKPDYSLGIGGGGHADQTGRMLLALEPILAAERPDIVLVYGDTNSTLGGALAAAKAGIPVAHIEAGLRVFDRQMPEELNRILTDHLSTWLFATTETALSNLVAEGLRTGAVLVGDVLQDILARTVERVRDPSILYSINVRLVAGEAPALALVPGGYFLATVHRAENREAKSIVAWLRLLGAIATRERPVVLLLHPGTSAAVEAHAVRFDSRILVARPVGYAAMIALQLHAAAVLTDSGGVQRESAWLGTPCLVLRSATEWIETLDPRANVALVGTDVALAMDVLRRLAPASKSGPLAVERARSLKIQEMGASAAIVHHLAARPAPGNTPTGDEARRPRRQADGASAPGERI